MADIKFDIHYKKPPEKIWRAITDSDTIAKWLMPNNFKPELGYAFEFRGFEGWNGFWAKMFMGPGWRGKLKKTIPELAA